MRHGRKSRSGKFNGCKTHITKDVDSDIITNIDVSSGNCPDGNMAKPLIDEATPWSKLCYSMGLIRNLE